MNRVNEPHESQKEPLLQRPRRGGLDRDFESAPTIAMRAARFLVACFAAVFAAAPDVQAQPYPAKPVRIIVPFAAGGTPVVVARVTAPQPSIRPARPSSWRIGPAPTAPTVAELAADGYTMTRKR
jgi:hypothetical protein